MRTARRRWIGLTLAATLLAAAFASSTPAGAASSSVTITFSVASFTSIDASGCPAGSSSVAFPAPVAPGTTDSTTVDCAIGFGTNAPSASLRVSQTDGAGDAMFRPATGSLDTTFGCGTPPCAGSARYATSAGSGADFATNLLVQPDGRLLVGGYGGTVGTDQDMKVVRLLADGAIDTSWGCATPPCSGIASTNVQATAMDDVSRGLALQPDGRVLQSGKTKSTATNADIVVTRLTSSGVLDTNFGCATPPCSGMYQQSFTNNNGDEAWGVAERNGKVYVVGDSGALDNKDGFVLRLLANGTLDTTYGCATPPCSGWRIVPASVAGTDTLREIAFQPDGSLVSTGNADVDPTATITRDGVVTRVTASGVPDTTFGCATPPCSGTALLDFGGDNDTIINVAVLPDGRIVATGTTNASGNDNAVIVRLLANGTLDPSFGCATPPCAGWRSVDASGTGSDDSGFGGLVVLDTGRLLQVGTVDVDPTAGVDRDFLAIRYLADGTFDPTFGCGRAPCSGIARVPIGSIDDQGDAVAALPDGKFLMAGWSTGAGGDMAVARFDSSTIGDLGDAGGTFGAAPSGVFGACLRRTTGSVTVADWLVDGSPIANDGDCQPRIGEPWNPIPTNSGMAGSIIAHSTAAQTDAVARLRFGARPGDAQPVGAYLAPITFEVLTP